MLTPSDKVHMALDIERIDDSDGVPIKILKLKPLDQQPSWNSKLREFVSKPLYDSVDAIAYERVVNESMIDITVGGNHTNRSVIINLSDKYMAGVDEYSIITFDRSPTIEWKVSKIVKLIGESAVTIIEV